MKFDDWFSEHRANDIWMNGYMDYFYNWDGWTKKTNLDPLSYRAWMKEKFDKLFKTTNK